MSQKSPDAQTFQPRYPECVTLPPGGEKAVSLAKRIYLTAGVGEDFRTVAERMYRALLGVEVQPFVRRKGIPGLAKKERA